MSTRRRIAPCLEINRRDTANPELDRHDVISSFDLDRIYSIFLKEQLKERSFLFLHYYNLFRYMFLHI